MLFHHHFSRTTSGGYFSPPKITLEDNVELLKPITKEELRLALFQMHPDKSPGPDGFNATFFQRFWSLCGDEIFEATKCWMDRGFFPSSLNETNICLIPKCDSPKSMKDMRPISLCNVLYKMLSKLLANRLKRCMTKCVSEEQSEFLERRICRPLFIEQLLKEIFLASKILGEVLRFLTYFLQMTVLFFAGLKLMKFNI